MNLPEICIKRPVFTVVLSLILILLGILGFKELPVSNLPQINKPVVGIKTSYPGASASLVAQAVTQKIEAAVANVNGLDTTSSSSLMGESDINLQFTLATDVNVAVADVRNQVASILHDLPRNVNPPVVKKANPDAKAILVIAFSGAGLYKEPLALSDYLLRYLVQPLEQVDGVSSVNIWGVGDYAMRVWLDPTKMAARNVTATDIMTALQQQNVSIPAGQIQSKDREYSMVVSSTLSTPQEFRNVVIRNDAGTLTRLGDVATVEVGTDNPYNAMRVDGNPAVALGIVPDTQANPINVVANAEQVLSKLSLPEGMHYKVIFDRSQFISASIHDVYRTLVITIFLVLLVIYAFLGSVRSASIPIVTIPVCLFSGFGVLAALGYSINTVTLLALVLSIGLVVDDAIVVLENSYRHLENGMDQISAAKKGSQEIVFAIIAMTITLAAVYAPTGFVSGITGQIFRPFAFTLAGVVLVSGFVALTLTPMMCSRLLKHQTTSSGYPALLDRFFKKLLEAYQRLLRKVLSIRPAVIIGVIVIGALGYGVFKLLPSELAPTEDEGAIVTYVNAPDDASFSYTDDYVKKIEAIYQSLPHDEWEHYFVRVGSPDNHAFSVLTLTPWGNRDKTQAQITQALRKQMARIPGVDAFPTTPAPLGIKTSSQHSFEMMITSEGGYADLYKTTQDVKNALSLPSSPFYYPGLNDIDQSLKIDSTQVNIDINRDLAAEMNVNLGEAANTISTLLGGDDSNTFNYNNMDYTVMVQMPYIKSVEGLKNIYVRNTLGGMVPLSSFTSISHTVVPLELDRYNQLPSDALSAELGSGYNLGDVVNHLQQVMPQLLPSNAHFDFSGPVREYLESGSRMALAFILAMVFIYLVLSAQFESFIDPVIIMMAVPLCIVGALTVLWITGNSLNIYSNIGLVTLVGLIAKHGILITEFANQLQAQGKTKMEAIISAASLRLRPILMTTAAMVLGSIPLALATGAGAAARHQVGWVIVGGMLFGTFFSLFVVPVAYTYLGRACRER